MPIYQGTQKFNREQNRLGLDVVPQASCTGTLINKGQHLISASHCFRDLCEARPLKKKYHKKTDFFILVGNKKIFFEEIHLHPLYCKLAYELPYEEKIEPNPLFPEIAYDIAIAKVKDEFVKTIKKAVPVFPKIRFNRNENENFEELTKIGYGVSSRFELYQTLWSDKDNDNVHDYWDLCPDTKETLIPSGNRITFEHMLSTDGCSAKQTPLSPAIALDYYTSNKISHKRGYNFFHFSNNSFIFKILNLNENLFLVNHGFYGSLKPYKNFPPLSFGGDSGGPSFTSDFSEIVAITILMNNSQEFLMEQIKFKKTTGEKRRDLLHGGFNVLLKTSSHKDFILESINK